MVQSPAVQLGIHKIRQQQRVYLLQLPSPQLRQDVAPQQIFIFYSGGTLVTGHICPVPQGCRRLKGHRRRLRGLDKLLPTSYLSGVLRLLPAAKMNVSSFAYVRSLFRHDAAPFLW